jgi:glyoxylase-like metal-dependent hydrolase (beta-lactamase superfamily II)
LLSLSPVPDRKGINTHQDLDHIGGLPSIINELAHPVEILASSVEKPFIQGQQPLLKLTPEAIASAVESLPPEVPTEWRQAFKSTLENPPKTQVDTIVRDGEVLPYCGGIEVIHTPGHTPGHISLYHRVSKTLIAADAMTVVEGQLMGPAPAYTLDLKLAKDSLKRLTQYDIEHVICYHGGVIHGDVNHRILELSGE